MKELQFTLFALFFTVYAYGAKVDTIPVYSKAMKKEIKCIFITPEKNSKTERFPVVYVLHGYSGNPSRTLKQDIPDLAEQSERYQMIFVLPDGGYDSWYFDSIADDNVRYETFISKELISFTDQCYPTLPAKNKRAIYGWSMGGQGALYLAIRHKDLFGAAGSICGAVDFRPFTNAYGIEKGLGDFQTHQKSWEEHTALYQAGALKNKDLKIIIDCGLNDPLLNCNRALHQKLIDLKVDHDYTERPGAHNDAYWSKASAYQLLFIHNYFIQS